MSAPAVDPAAEALAVGAVLFRAHDAARHLENLLELEVASDPHVADLHLRARGLRESIGYRLVDVALDQVEITPDGRRPAVAGTRG